MKYILTVSSAAILLHLLSFAAYNWRQNLKLAAVGAALIGLVAFSLSLFVIYLGNQEL